MILSPTVPEQAPLRALGEFARLNHKCFYRHSGIPSAQQPDAIFSFSNTTAVVTLNPKNKRRSLNIND
jgi:hypothetical protein